MSRAVVLSGGGSVGIAWQTGLACGLAERGVDLAQAECVIGTSAGSAVGGQIALGRDLHSVMQRFVPPGPADAPTSSGGGDRKKDRAKARDSKPRPRPLMEQIAKAMASATDPKGRRAALGRFALEAQTIDEERFKRSFAYLGGEPWPRAFSCTAVDAESGDFVVWNEASNVDLVEAVASSCAVPGLFPPVTIDGRRYMDGGVRSGTNADLAKGHTRVLIVTLLGQGLGAGRGVDPMRRRAEREIAALDESGARVEQIEPDGEASKLMVMENLMNRRVIGEVAEMGLRHGHNTAERLREFWN